MMQHYFKVALRNLWKNKGYSAINIIGLATGLATCLLILLYVWDELSFDRYNKKASRVYRINNEIKIGENRFDLCQAPPLMGPVMATEFPQVEQYTRIMRHDNILVKKGNENLRETRVVYADSTLFDVFTLPMIAGNPATSLKEPHSIVITERIAKKYFNRIDVAGEKMVLNNTSSYKITGVIKNIPEQSHFNFDFFIAMSEEAESRSEESWFSQNYNTYILLKKGADLSGLVPEMNKLLERKTGQVLQSALNVTMDEFKQQGGFVRATLTPLTAIHLQSDKLGEIGVNGNRVYVYIFGIIAFFLLLIACVNFMNLSTARYAGRAKEVGVRKVLGSLRKNLVVQFLVESFFISFCSSVLAFTAAWLLLPLFNELAGKKIELTLLLQPAIFIIAIILMLVVGLLAGSYPAFFLSSFQPIKVLKGTLSKGLKGVAVRNVLVVFQFTVSIILIIDTIVIYNQLLYMHNRDLGFNREQVLIIQNTRLLDKNIKPFTNALASISGVQQATVSGYLPLNGSRSSDAFFTSPTLDQKTTIVMQRWKVDETYIPTLGIQVLEGRNFSADFPTDSNAIIINEAAARFLGPGQVLDKTLYRVNNSNSSKPLDYHIVGVIKNFNFNSLRDFVTPLAFIKGKETSTIAVRVKTGDLPSLLAQIKKTWKSMVPGEPFTYSFMDEEFNNQYMSEQKTGKLFITFAALAILIACLGLFGLATYAGVQRTKEIGIRKVLGASVAGIAGMLSKDFLKLVLIASCIAFPVAWWAMNKWLQDFAYRINIAWWIFIVAGALALLIALLTVSFQAIKAAIANPVKSLRTE